jgi:ClpP class serine protease
MDERQQTHVTRQPLISKLEELLGVPVVSFFTSTTMPVIIDDSDADVLVGFLQMMDLSKGLALVISSHGGDGVAAERIINICRAYSGTGEYWVIVPGKAKSAATMICFGASKIFMGPTSELGPVDPQIPRHMGDDFFFMSAYHIVESYKELIEEANTTSGNLEPYLQQLSHYDASVVQYLESQIDLAEDISVRALESGMMKDLNIDEITERVGMFLTPEDTITHGRPIYSKQAKGCGLEIEEMAADSEIWKVVYELYIRTNYFVSADTPLTRAVKCIENKEGSFIATQGG